MKSTGIIVIFILLVSCSKELVRYHGHQYNVIKVGKQYWMDENLATETYRNGKKIPFITDYNIWSELQSPGCCYYNNDTSMLREYGMLYNWYAVDGGKLCPLGWRVPTNDDWLNLEKYLGGHLRAGGRMKAVSGWYGRHVSGDDIGFKALPGGYRLNDDFQKGESGKWWSSSVAGKFDFQNDNLGTAYINLVNNDEYIWGRNIDYSSSELFSTLNKRNNGFAVRCVKAR